MFPQQTSAFPKQIKLDDYGDSSDSNIIRIVQSSNLLFGSGARSSQSAVVLAKTLHYLSEQKIFKLQGDTILQLGSGAGLLGIYLACLGTCVYLSDLSSIKDVAERNIGINKKIIKGRAQYIVANWKNLQCLGKCQNESGKSSTSSGAKQQCLVHLMPKIDLTIACESGGINDLRCQLNFIGKRGLIICFLQRPYADKQDYLNSRAVQQLLMQNNLNYENIEEYHPDYHDERVKIYHIWK